VLKTFLSKFFLSIFYTVPPFFWTNLLPHNGRWGQKIVGVSFSEQRQMRGGKMAHWHKHSEETLDGATL
jgi:hypothetical protein